MTVSLNFVMFNLIPRSAQKRQDFQKPIRKFVSSAVLQIPDLSYCSEKLKSKF